MKTIGIALLFALCSLIGIRISAQKAGRLASVRALRKDLQLFSERITGGCGTLMELASENGMLFERIGRYLAALSAGDAESAAADQTVEGFRRDSTEENGLRMFFNGLSSASRSDLIRRVNTLSPVLERAESEAEADAKQARVLRVSCVLVGVGIAILLL